MPHLAVWHGTADQLAELISITAAHQAQQALLDQRFIDGVLYARWLRDRLLAEEWAPHEPALSL